MSTNIFNFKYNTFVFIKADISDIHDHGYNLHLMDGVYTPPIRTSAAEKTDNAGGNIYKQQYNFMILK